MLTTKVLYDGASGPLRVLVIGALAYLAMVVLLRVSGKRTLSKMNAFDFIVTIALGSTLATALLSRDVPLADAITAFALLIGVQYVVTWLSVRVPVVSRMVKSQPAMLFYRGSMMWDVMRRERITEGEVLAAIREQGEASTSDVLAVVVETTGTLSVLRDTKPDREDSTLRHVAEAPDRERGAATTRS